MLPGERVPGVASELPEECAMRTAVALAERVQCVDLAEVVGQPSGERVPVHAMQEALLAEVIEDGGGRWLYVLREAEHGGLGDGDRPDLPGLVVDVGEGPPVDLAEMAEVVRGRDRRLMQQDQGGVGDLAFGGFKPGGSI